MKKSKIIVPALGLIALSTAASITGTVAWFTANNSVTITGMTFKTQVGNNLLVADDPTTATFKDSAFKQSLVQTKFARLEPVSSIDAVGFYYTTVSNDNGTAKDTSPFYQYGENTAISDTSSKKSQYDNKFNAKYVGGSIDAANVVYGYLDYTFYLKATFSAIGDKIIMDKCQLKYDSSGSGSSYGSLGADDKAWRIGVLAHKLEDSSVVTSAGETTITAYTTAMAAGDNVSILSPSGADYNAKTGGTSSTVADAVSGVSATARDDGFAPTYADVTNLNAAATIYTTTGLNESNKVIKVTVRVWIEGEDTKCFVDNYKALTNNYSLEVGFKTEATGTSPCAAVTNIATTVA